MYRTRPCPVVGSALYNLHASSKRRIGSQQLLLPVLTCRLGGSLLEWPELIAPVSRSLESPENMRHSRVQGARKPETGRLSSWMI